MRVAGFHPPGPAVPRLVLIGGGPSSLTVALRLAELVRLRKADGAAPDPFEVVLVDRAGETGGGAPHAATVSAALLLNDNIAETDSTRHRPRRVADHQSRALAGHAAQFRRPAGDALA